MAKTDTTNRTLISHARINRTNGKLIYWAVVVVVIILSCLVFLGPLYWMVTGGLKSAFEYAQNPPTLLPKHPLVSNYVDAWKDLTLGRLILNTLFYAFGALAFQIVLDVLAAFAFSKLRPAFGNVILGMMLGTLMVPAAVMVIPQYVTVINLPIFHVNMLNTPWVIWLPAVAANAFNIFLLKRFFDSIPEDLLAAAAIDGAGPLRTLRSIIVPMSRPILGVISIFTITGVWKDFLWPLLVLPSEQYRTVNVGIFAFSHGLAQNTVLAGAVIGAIPTIIFFLIFQKNIMAGLTTGGLRG
jgi:multiple sugar transport system permease protein